MESVYKSMDGLIFQDSKACAKYELETFPKLLETLNEHLEGVPPSFKLRWCESGACGCMGCINAQFYAAGLTKSHWEVWKDELYNGPTLIDPYDDSFGVILKSVDEVSKVKVMQLLRQHCGYGIVQVGETLKTLPQDIKNGIMYEDAKKFHLELTNAGASASIFKDTLDNIVKEETKTISIKLKN